VWPPAFSWCLVRRPTVTRKLSVSLCVFIAPLHRCSPFSGEEYPEPDLCVYFGDRQSLEHSKKIIRGGSNSEIPKFVRYSRPSRDINSFEYFICNTLPVGRCESQFRFRILGTSSYIFDMLTKVS
jgi:hypothetical protein